VKEITFEELIDEIKREAISDGAKVSLALLKRAAIGAREESERCSKLFLSHLHAIGRELKSFALYPEATPEVLMKLYEALERFEKKIASNLERCGCKWI